MMTFVDLTQPERVRFIKQTTGCHIPGYTGHCPTLKFRFGKRYGANTKEIIDELRDRSPIHDMKPYKQDDPELRILKDTVRDKGEEGDPLFFTNLPKRPYVLGYTGYIPGLNFQYGSSFSHAADKSVMEFSSRLADDERKREKERMQCINTTPKMSCVRGRDEVSRTLETYTNRVVKKPVPKISPELPPIAGYTGHIPRLKGSEASLSQRYHSAAQTGLILLSEERNRHRHLEIAKEAVKDAIAYSHVQ